MLISCPICSSQAETPQSFGFDGETIHCPRCGEYRISGTANAMLPAVFESNVRQVANASGWIRAHQKELISTETIPFLRGLATPPILERANWLLKYWALKSAFLGEKFCISKLQAQHPNTVDDRAVVSILELMGITWAANGIEVLQFIDYLINEGFLTQLHNSSTTLCISVSADGFAYLEKQNAINLGSQIGFCAMWFDNSVNPLWHRGIDPAIRNAGYQPLRIDKKEHVNRIDDEIFADIRRSRFVVADFTHGESGVRGGVYFEAGFAQGLGLPVIWTCRSDMLVGAKLHFDIRQYNFLEWSEDTLDDFSGRLQNRIEAILGRGTWKPE